MRISMGNCWRRCFRRPNFRSYLRARYNVRETSVEYESLVDNDTVDAPLSAAAAAMTDYERQLLSERKFHDIVQYQIKIDAEIEAQLIKQENQLRKEEEAFYEAKRLAAKAKHPAAVAVAGKSNVQPEDHTRSMDSSIVELAAGEEDFDEFLAHISAESMHNENKSNDAPEIASTELPDQQSNDDSEWNPEFVSAASES